MCYQLRSSGVDKQQPAWPVSNHPRLSVLGKIQKNSKLDQTVFKSCKIWIIASPRGGKNFPKRSSKNDQEEFHEFDQEHLGRNLGKLSIEGACAWI